MRERSHLWVVKVREIRSCVHVGPHQSCDQRDRRARGRFLRRLGFWGEPAPAALQRVSAHYFLDHAHSEALLEAAELTAVTASLVHRARFVGKTHVLGPFLNSPLEETLAALASPHSVVLAGCGVSTHSTQLRWRLGSGPTARSGHCAPCAGSCGCCWCGRRDCDCWGHHVAQSTTARGRGCWWRSWWRRTSRGYRPQPKLRRFAATAVKNRNFFGSSAGIYDF